MNSNIQKKQLHVILNCNVSTHFKPFPNNLPTLKVIIDYKSSWA